MNPNGGLLARFPGLTMPSLGFTFYGATPGNDFATNIYTIEYDGFADFPQYPIDFLAHLNALAGIYYVHGTYADLTPTQINSAISVDEYAGPHHYPRPPDSQPASAAPLAVASDSRRGQPGGGPARARHEGARQLGLRQP